MTNKITLEQFIEGFFYIRNQSGIVTLNDFKQGIS